MSHHHTTWSDGGSLQRRTQRARARSLTRSLVRPSACDSLFASQAQRFLGCGSGDTHHSGLPSRSAAVLLYSFILFFRLSKPTTWPTVFVATSLPEACGAATIMRNSMYIQPNEERKGRAWGVGGDRRRAMSQPLEAARHAGDLAAARPETRLIQSETLALFERSGGGRRPACPHASAKRGSNSRPGVPLQSSSVCGRGVSHSYPATALPSARIAPRRRLSYFLPRWPSPAAWKPLPRHGRGALLCSSASPGETASAGGRQKGICLTTAAR